MAELSGHIVVSESRITETCAISSPVVLSMMTQTDPLFVRDPAPRYKSADPSTPPIGNWGSQFSRVDARYRSVCHLMLRHCF